MLEKTYPFFTSPAYKYIISISIGLFLYLFLIAFLPFGISNYNPNHQYTLSFLLEISIFGIGTMAVSFLNELLFKRVIKSPVSIMKVIGWSLWSILLIGFCLYVLYNFLGNWHDWSFTSAVRFILEVSMVFIFPMAGVFFFFQYRSLKAEYNTALTSKDSVLDINQLITIEGQGTRERISLPVRDFVFAQAQDNYAEINYRKNDETMQELFRVTLSALEKNLDKDYLIRCHRSYLVNAHAVSSIHGGKNDLTLQMSISGSQIPVSRKQADRVLQTLRKYKSFN